MGSILQAFALTDFLKSTGFESIVWLENWNRIINKNKPRGAKDYLKIVYRALLRGKIKASHDKRQSFVTSMMNVEYLANDEAFRIMATEHKNEVFLAGSDQIWNPERCNHIFFLDFADKSRRISYAASMGSTKLDEEKRELYKSWLSSFDSISVREKACKKVLEELTEKEISVNIDPTFLVEREKWIALEKEYPIKGKFILLYMLYWNSGFKDELIELKRRTGLPIYCVCPDVSGVYADHRLYDVGVEEFLWLVDHAEYVVTSSFHGAAFSIIFKKQFAPLINPSQPSRIQNLLEVLSVSPLDIKELGAGKRINYDGVDERIEKERQRSSEYLKEAIG